MHPLIQLKETIAVFLVTFGLACFGLSPRAQAVLPSPTPDGGYPNQNTAEGDNALLNLSSGANNTALGFQALLNNTTGSENTATGANALLNNISGIRNTAVGANALFANTTGNVNTACGFNALQHNTTGIQNTASGPLALGANTTGNGNTAFGNGTLAANTSGSFNLAVGFDAGANLTTGRDNIDIGHPGVAGDTNTMRIGNVHQTATFIAGISGVAVTGALVQVNAAGQLGVAPSAARFKDEIKPMGDASEGILALKPVSFRYKREIDPKRAPQFGLVAEEVAKVNPDLVVRHPKGELYTVRYDAVNAMLLNEFLKEHRHVEEQDAIIARQQKQIDTLTAGLQKVSAQLEVGRPASQTVLNNQ